MSNQESSKKSLEDWAGSNHLILALIFTDIVESTAIGIKLSDYKWIEDLFKHFSRARQLASNYDCYVVKAIGDSLMMAFRTPTSAVKFALEFATDTGVDHIGIRIGINSGEVQIRENDIYGLNVNFTSRVQHSLPLEGVLMSNSVKRDYEKTFGGASDIRFVAQEADLKSFGNEILWKAIAPYLRKAIGHQRIARRRLLGVIP